MDIITLAGSQHGLVGLWQLRRAGWSRKRIRCAIAAQRLLIVAPGVAALGHRPSTREARWMAGVLEAGPGALLSHRSAAVQWGILRADPVVEVTTSGAVRSRPGRLVVHRSRVGGADRTRVDGIPMTALPRTLVDLTDELPPAELALAVERVPHLDVRTMRRCLARHPGRRAVGALGRVLDAYDPETRSPLEDAMRVLCRRHRLPRPLVNVRIEGAERDFSWPQARLVVETDGHAFHSSRRQRNADARRDIALGIAGWRVHRFTYEQVLLDPAGTASALAALMAI